jgi:hypothetical protein
VPQLKVELSVFLTWAKVGPIILPLEKKGKSVGWSGVVSCESFWNRHEIICLPGRLFDIGKRRQAQ